MSNNTKEKDENRSVLLNQLTNNLCFYFLKASQGQKTRKQQSARNFPMTAAVVVVVVVAVAVVLF